MHRKYVENMNSHDRFDYAGYMSAKDGYYKLQSKFFDSGKTFEARDNGNDSRDPIGWVVVSSNAGQPFWYYGFSYNESRTNAKYIGNNKKSLKLQGIAKEKINTNSQASSNKDDQKKFINNGLHTQILAPLQSYQHTNTKSDDCSECGLSLNPDFNFCPGCGAKF